MRIWHLIDTLEVGGAETMVATLCRWQKSAGLSPSVHCLHRGGKIAEQLSADGIPVRIHGERSLIRLGFRLRRLMQTERPDVIHCHNEAAAIAGAPAAAAANIQNVVATRHGLVPPGVFFRREIKFWAAARFCRYVVAVCRTAYRNLAQGPLAIPEKLVTIYNAAAPARRGPASADDGRKICEEGDFAIINVARHSKEKDLDTLLSAYHLARRQAPSMRLILVGSGALTQDLRQQAAGLGIAQDVRFLGERSDIGCLLAQANLFVLSSVSEGTPISLLEAMEAGLPQVVTNVGGMPEILDLSGGGLVVPPRSPEPLAEALLRFANDEILRKECGEKSRDCYYRQFTPERMTSDYLALYTKAVPMPGQKSIP